MAVPILIARVLLAAVFLLAGLAKAADRAGSRRAIMDWGVPEVLAAPLGVLLPAAELAVAVALMAGASSWWGAQGALSLLLLFAAGIGVNLARGRHPDCHCFGQLHSAPAGWPALLRNVGLAAVAGLVVGLGRGTTSPGFFTWFTELPAAGRVAVAGGAAMAALVAGGGWVLVQVMTQQGRLLIRIEALEAGPAAAGRAAAGPGLPAGVPAPGFILPGLTGEVTGLATLRARDKPVVLVFSAPDCGPCTALLPEIGRWEREHAPSVTVALISRGPVDAVRAKAGEHQLRHVLVQTDAEVAEAYQVHATPSAVLVGRDGTIAGPLALGADAIRALLAAVAGPPEGPPAGAPPVLALAGAGPRHPAALPLVAQSG